jgi:hypothetical protein
MPPKRRKHCSPANDNKNTSSQPRTIENTTPGGATLTTPFAPTVGLHYDEPDATYQHIPFQEANNNKSADELRVEDHEHRQRRANTSEHHRAQLGSSLRLSGQWKQLHSQLHARESKASISISTSYDTKKARYCTAYCRESKQKSGEEAIRHSPLVSFAVKCAIDETLWLASRTLTCPE